MRFQCHSIYPGPRPESLPYLRPPDPPIARVLAVRDVDAC